MFNIKKDQVLDHEKFHFIFGSIKYRLNTQKLTSWHYYREFLFEIISYPFRICFEQPTFLNNFKNSIKDINIETNDKDIAILNKQKKIVEESLKIKTFVTKTGLNLNFSNNEKNTFDSLQEILEGINKRIEFLTNQHENEKAKSLSLLSRGSASNNKTLTDSKSIHPKSEINNSSNENSEKRIVDRSSSNKIILFASGVIAAAGLGMYFYSKICKEPDDLSTPYQPSFVPGMELVATAANALITFPNEVFPNYIDFNHGLPKTKLNQHYFTPLSVSDTNENHPTIHSTTGAFSLCINIGIPVLAAFLGLKSFWNLVENGKNNKTIKHRDYTPIYSDENKSNYSTITSETKNNNLTSVTTKLATSSLDKPEIKAILIETNSSSSQNFTVNHTSLSLPGLEIDSDISKKQKSKIDNLTNIDEHITSAMTPYISKPIAIENPKETTNNIQIANESLKNYKKNLLESLSQNIENQKKNKTYIRPQLKPLEKQVSNLPIPVASITKKVVEFSKTFSGTATFYGYNAEDVRDYGWGCAWRTIQTCLSPYKINPTFEELFHLFGPFENLKQIYEDKYPEKKLSNSKLFAPYDLTNGWAEPFIGHMVMHFYDRPSALETLNGIPGNCNAPKDVFHNKPLNFESFKERLNTHFESEAPAPIMIDDGLFALNIVGVKSEGSNTTLWIADPHIKEGVNKSIDTEKSPVGLYTVTLNSEGEKISCSLADQDNHQVMSMYSAKSYEGLQFDSKRWMILFPMKP